MVKKWRQPDVEHVVALNGDDVPGGAASFGWKIVEPGEQLPPSAEAAAELGSESGDWDEHPAIESAEGLGENLPNEGAVANHSAVSLDNNTDARESAPRTSDVMLVTLGIAIGVYGLYTVGWAMSAQTYSVYYRDVVASSGVLGDVLYQILIWVTVLAPAAWFLSVLRLTRADSSWKRIAWLVLGMLVLIPVPNLFQQVVL